MKRISFLFLVFSMLLTACGATPSNPTATAMPATVAAPATETPAPSAATETPIATPTRQASRTPSAPQTCPQTDKKTRANFAPAFKGKKVAYHDARQVVLDFLNAGGIPQSAIDKLAENGVTASLLDVTSDGVPELLLPSGYLSIFGCQDGKYVSLLDLAPTEGTGYEPVTLNIQDLNQNGVPEIFLAQVLNDRVRYSLLEWDGKHLVSIVQESYQSSAKLYIENHDIYAVGQGNDQKGAINGNWQLVDIDNDGLKEIAIKAGVTSKFVFNADLEEQIILKSTGADYQVASFSKEFTPTPKPTYTPLPFSARCDYKAPDVQLDTSWGDGSPVPVVEHFLNLGGDPQDLRKYFDITIKDLNNDGVDEIIVIKNLPMSSIYIFSCINGAYKSSLEDSDFYPVNSIKILSTDDINKDGLPEIVLRDLSCFMSGCAYLSIAEWDGTKFATLIKDGSGTTTENYAEIFYYKDAYLKDIDNDGIPELIGLSSPNEDQDPGGLPWRVETYTYKWDGEHYKPLLVEYSEPHYIFQAVQDGDSYVLDGQYEKALASYKNAIQNDKLEWWSEDRFNALRANYGIGPCAEKGAKCPATKIDANEKPILQAYSYFRMMVTQLMMGQPSGAENTYKTMLMAYPLDADKKIIVVAGNSPAVTGSIISKMADAFWQEYQASHSMGNACKKAVAFANTQAPFWQYIGSSYMGFQMRTYHAEDVCPFK